MRILIFCLFLAVVKPRFRICLLTCKLLAIVLNDFLKRLDPLSIKIFTVVLRAPSPLASFHFATAALFSLILEFLLLIRNTTFTLKQTLLIILNFLFVFNLIVNLHHPTISVSICARILQRKRVPKLHLLNSKLDSRFV